MAAGYNGLESGIPIIASAAMVIVLMIKGHDAGAAVVFAGLIGAASAVFHFNKFPAKVFVGDVGTLGFGATYATAAILGNVAIYAVIAILPMFFEFFATFYYASRRQERRYACHHPILLPRGRIQPPKGCGNFTLAYYLLAKKPMTEPELVNRILCMYIVCGIAAILLAFLP
jgi:UDP-N-acetylmuramyl pentapeptide phosphotransferase/UDP-N-acetylglucosamine-1-phosphate transferase